MTPERWARMSWHARERHADALRREVQRLEARLSSSRASAAARRAAGELLAEETARDAGRILATLPADAHAAQHRVDLWQALTRKDRT